MAEAKTSLTVLDIHKLNEARDAWEEAELIASATPPAK